ncbi:MAG: HAD hydrolase-like protein [Lentisphaerota bacterium]
MMSAKTFLEWWLNERSNFEAILFDIDGTLVSGLHLRNGADVLLEQLRRQNFPFYLLTNDGNHSIQEKSIIVSKAGLKISPEEIVSCGMAIANFVSHHNAYRQTFFVMGDLGKPCYAEIAGLKVCRDVSQIHNCSGVIIGEGFYDWQQNINAVLNFFINKPDMPLLVPNPDSYWHNGKGGELGIGAGGKARFICGILEEMGIAVKPEYFGKPYSAIYEYTVDLLKKRFNLPNNIKYCKILMLGDSLKSDIKGANILGIKSGLMLTGITTEKQAMQAQGEQKPDFIFKSIG